MRRVRIQMMLFPTPPESMLTGLISDLAYLLLFVFEQATGLKYTATRSGFDFTLGARGEALIPSIALANSFTELYLTDSCLSPKRIACICHSLWPRCTIMINRPSVTVRICSGGLRLDSQMTPHY